GIEVDSKRGLADASGSLALSTILAAIYGYPAASAVAKHAAQHDLPIGQAAVEYGLMSEQDSRRPFADPSAFTDAGRSERLIADLNAQLLEPPMQPIPYV